MFQLFSISVSRISKEHVDVFVTEHTGNNDDVGLGSSVG